MKNLSFLAIIGSLILFSAFTVSNSISWQIADGYSIQFEGTDAKGIFKEMTGDIQFDAENPENSSFAFNVVVSSISTGNGMKNRHAKGEKWFDAKNHPNITFQSKSVAKDGEGYLVTGTMNIHGVAKEMTIPFAFNGDAFTSQYSVNRMDFGVGTMKGMSKKVSNEIKLDITIPVTK